MAVLGRSKLTASSSSTTREKERQGERDEERPCTAGFIYWAEEGEGV